MLLQRIKLKGFLAHRGVQGSNGDGYDLPVELDFRGSALWLVHGANGSGKSSIFDAVTFALFDHVRGRKNRFGDFINDVCDDAEVEIEVKIGGVGYQVNRRVSRGRGGRGAGANNGRVHRHTATGPQIVPGTENNVPAWTGRELRMSYENFVCAAILRQGEADLFLRAKPAERKEQLMKLLDLEVYKRLGEAANTRKTDTQNHLRNRQTALDACPAVTEADVEATREAVRLADETLQTTQDELQLRQTMLRDAEQAAGWLNQIADKEKQQGQDAAILSEALRIEADATRRRVLEEGLPLIAEVWKLRDASQSEQDALAQAQESLRIHEEKLSVLEPQLSLAREAVTLADEEVTQATTSLRNAGESKTALDRELKDLSRVEDLEKQIADAGRAIAPHRELLAAEEEIQQDFESFQNLETGGRKLRPLVKATSQLSEAETELNQVREVLETARTAASQAKIELEARENAVTQADEEVEAARLGVEATQRDWHSLHDKLQSRAGLDDAVECPTCGSQLHEAHTHERLRREQESWDRDAARLGDELTQLKNTFRARRGDVEEARVAQKASLDASNEARTASTTAQTHEVNSLRRHDEAQKAREEARLEAGEWASRESEYQAICDEYTRLKQADVTTRHKELQIALRAASNAEAMIAVCQKQLDTLSQWPPEEREQLRGQFARCEKDVSVAQNALDTAQLAASEAEKESQQRAGQHRKLIGERDLARGLCENGARRVQKANEDLEQALNDLPSLWAQHPAMREADERARLQREFGDLAHAPDRVRALSEARQRVNSLGAAIATLQGQLATLPEAHRIAPEVARANLDSAETERGKVQNTRDAAHQQFNARQNQRDAFIECQSKRDEAERALSRAQKLASAFGPNGLQARIVSEAQRDIAILANDTLDKLSQGQWQIDLENTSETELEILACDLARNGKKRPFECLSGGERFRVAISLAIAIGQSACGGHALSTLVIDEGFGALDDVNRGLLVSELRRLSENVLRGGRIIIVSHQEDVCSEFDFRYHVSRDKDGYAQVERFTP